MSKKERLIILDLDNTLIYSSYGTGETATLLCQYSELIRIYERPYAREFIESCKKLGDVIVYTLAEKDYAESVCNKLNINPLQIIAGDENFFGQDENSKRIKATWYKSYNDIVVVDDSPELWRMKDRNKARFIVPPEFFGDAQDNALRYINLLE